MPTQNDMLNFTLFTLQIITFVLCHTERAKFQIYIQGNINAALDSVRSFHCFLKLHNYEKK